MLEMDPASWEGLYKEILDDFGYSRYEDEASARLLKTLMQNADLIDDEDIPLIVHDYGDGFVPPLL